MENYSSAYDIYEELDDNQLKLQMLTHRLKESEQLLEKINQLTDSAYLALTQGDANECRHQISCLALQLSHYFHDEVH